MALDDIPLFSMLKSRLGYLSDRQRVVSENVANSDTPGYTPQDLKPFSVTLGNAMGGPLALAPVQLSAPAANTMPLSNANGAGKWRLQASPDSETKLNGNQVVLEEEMMKMSDARSNYDAAITFYQKSLGLLQLAIRTPGKGA